MDEAFRKMQFGAQDRIYVRGAPPEFRARLAAMKPLTRISTRAPGKTPVGFALFFVRRCSDIVEIAPLFWIERR